MPRFLLLLLLAITGPASAQTLPLLPAPQTVIERDDVLTVDARTTIVASDPGARAAAIRLGELMGRTVGLSPRVARAGTIRFVRAGGIAREGYRIEVTHTGATVTASDDAGLFYGAVTLWQMARRTPGGIAIPGAYITDAPRFAWRGIMLDSARHMQSPAFIHRFIDAMAANKLNVLQWHLVDDQGWRLPVPKWPLLTQVSGFRLPAVAPGAPPLPREGGFYTAAQIREIVAYAAARHVAIVPEIELPGHALSAIRAYPRLGLGVPIPAGTESDWGVFPWLYNTDDATFRFIDDVLGETMRLFPSRYIHIGGDEAVKDQWRASPAVQAKMRMLGIGSEGALQSWFVNRVGRYLSAHGRKLVGWDEILAPGIAADATIMSWRGIGAAAAAAKAGHDTVLSPAPVLYLDNRQGVDAVEGPGRGTLVTLADVYAFDPMPPSLTVEQQRHVLGVQANLWTEYVRGDARAGQMAFPRASALAERGWSTRAPDFGDFIRRLPAQMARMRALGVVPSDAAFRPVATLSPSGKAAEVVLATQAGLPVRYTLDGATPTVQATEYDGPLSVRPGTRLRAASFLGGEALPGAIDIGVDARSIRRRDDTQLALCGNAVPLRLEDDYPAAGPRAAFLTDIMDPCWIYRAAPMDGVRTIEVAVGQLPFNFQLGRDADKIRFRPPATLAGEMEVRDGCDGAVVATLPLAPAAGNPGVTTLSAPIAPLTGGHDLCLTYTARGVKRLWAIASVQLVAAP